MTGAASSVGNPLLDKQHIVLAELVQSLADAPDAMDARAFTDALRDLVDLARRHCAAEEHQLARNGFEWVEQHHADHAAGMDRLHVLCEMHAQGKLARADACAAAVRWLDAHLQDMDLPVREWMRPDPGSS